MRIHSALFLLPLLGALACQAPVGQAEPPAAAAELPAAAHDFDFWVGDWECRDPDGKLDGTNRITLECGGRVLQEHWADTGGGVGTSLNIWDPVAGTWHQTWVDQYGTLLQLDGGLDEAGRMVMRGTRPRRDGGGEVLHQIMWTPDAGAGTVHQLWTWSIDDGGTWSVAADLTYSPR
jgi:hypothetical protein